MKNNILLAYLIGALALLGCISGCDRSGTEQNKTHLLVYSTLYEESSNRINAALRLELPNAELDWKLGTTAEISAKIRAEMPQGLHADLILTNDEKLLEELSLAGALLPFHPESEKGLAEAFQQPGKKYSVINLPANVLVHGALAPEAEEFAKQWRDLANPIWKNSLAAVAPEKSKASQTVFQVLTARLGAEQLKKIEANSPLFVEGPSVLFRRMLTGERKIAWVLLDQIIRLRRNENRLSIQFPEDGVIFVPDFLAIPKSSGASPSAEKLQQIQAVYTAFFTKSLQAAVSGNLSYSPLLGMAPPEGCPSLGEILKKNPEFRSSANSK